MTNFNDIRDILIRAKQNNETVTLTINKKEYSGKIQAIGNNHIVVKSDTD